MTTHSIYQFPIWSCDLCICPSANTKLSQLSRVYTGSTHSSCNDAHTTWTPDGVYTNIDGWHMSIIPHGLNVITRCSKFELQHSLPFFTANLFCVFLCVCLCVHVKMDIAHRPTCLWSQGWHYRIYYHSWFFHTGSEDQTQALHLSSPNNFFT